MEVDPVFTGRNFNLKEDLCFVLIPLHEPFISIFERHIKPVAAKCGLAAVKADDIYSNKPVMEDVWAYLNQANLVIADLTDSNPNVFYEVGIAHTLGKEVIMISQHTTKVPFDVGHVRNIDYVYPSKIEQFEFVLQETILRVLADLKVKRAEQGEPQKKESQGATNIRAQRLDSLEFWSREWLSKNLPKLVESDQYLYGDSYWQARYAITGVIRDEVVRRWGLSGTTAKDYSDAVFLTIEPDYKTQIEESLRKRREHVEAERQKALAEMRSSLTVFKSLESQSGPLVERNSLRSALMKANGWTEEMADKAIRTLFREGIIYEQRPGFLRRLGA